MSSRKEIEALSAAIRLGMDEGRGPDQIAREALKALRTDTVRAAYSNDGGACPVCDQHVKVRRLSLNPMHVEALAIAYADVEGDTTMFFHAPSMTHRRASRQVVDFAVLANFGLIERLELAKAWATIDTRGVYRLTDLGVRWLRGEAAVPRSLRMYNTEVVDAPGQPATVADVWGRSFDVDSAPSVRARAKRGFLAEASRR